MEGVCGGGGGRGVEGRRKDNDVREGGEQRGGRGMRRKGEM